MSPYLLTIGFIVVIWLLQRWRLRHFVKLANSVPSNKLHTWLGFGPILRRSNTSNYINTYGKKYGKNSVFWSGPYSAFLTSDPVSVKDILTTKNCVDKPTEYIDAFHLSSGKGLLLLNDPEWTQHRKILNTAFTNKNLISFVSIFNNEVDNIIQRIDSNIRIGKNEMKILPLFREMTFCVITQTILKRKFDKQSIAPNELTETMERAIRYITDLSYNLTLKFDLKFLENAFYKEATKSIKTLRGFIKESIEMYIIQKENNENSGKDAAINGAIDHAINGFKQNKLKQIDLEYEVFHLYIAAFDTTSNILYSIIVLLAMHPEYQERLYEEISSILIDSEESTVSIENVELMAYMDMVVNEALRILPSIPQLIRCVHGKSVTLSNGITLPEGQTILIDLYNLHRNKEVWGPDADQFNPDNFLPANMESKQYAFAPFAKGVRNCIGWKYALLSVKVTLAKLLRKYKFSTDFKYKNLKIQSFVVIEFVEHPTLKIEKR